MKIEKTLSKHGINVLNIQGLHAQQIWFDTETQRDIVFKHWEAAIEELNVSKAVFRPVYEESNGDTRILKLRYTTPEEIKRVEQIRKEHFPTTDMKLIMIYNEQERTFQNVNN